MLGLLAAASFSDGRLPEVMTGLARERGCGPVPYPHSCSPQAWASASAFALLSATLGMRLEASDGRLLFQHPTLPAGVSELEIRNLRLGESRVDLLVHRLREHVGVSVKRLDGEGEVVIIP